MTLKEFLRTDLTLLALNNGKVVFTSKKGGIRPILDYLLFFNPKNKTVFFDRIIGRAAALLFVRARAKEVFTQKVSTAGLAVLDEFKIPCHFEEEIPRVLNSQQTAICPMETLAWDKSPDEFYNLLIERSQ